MAYMDLVESLGRVFLGVTLGTIAGLLMVTTGLWVLFRWPERWGG